MLNYPNFWNYKSFLSYLLFPFSIIYYLAIKIRELIAKPINFESKVICVGNATVGGTGKTQLIMFIAEDLSKKGHKFFIIAKGYGGKFHKTQIVNEFDNPALVGDEALMMAQKYPVIITKKAIYLQDFLSKLPESDKPEYLIFDDGLQNPFFKKDLIIMTIDGYRAYGNQMLIPAGPMRMTINEANKKGDIYIVIGQDIFSVADDLPAEKTIFAKISPMSKIDNSLEYYAFAAIGNPDKFFITLKESGCNLIKTKAFPDHHFYSGKEIEELLLEAEDKLVLITTAKDYVKIPDKYRNHILCLDVKLDLALPINWHLL